MIVFWSTAPFFISSVIGFFTRGRLQVPVTEWYSASQPGVRQPHHGHLLTCLGSLLSSPTSRSQVLCPMLAHWKNLGEVLWHVCAVRRVHS